ncbi:MAG: hypothetical protein GPJ14_07590 [Microcystis aeruginosa G11-01]|jgi:hypothetical protein|nr:hypothetical protein [Microcystis aeruginosa G13-10]NCS03431.1 hypothetical protein [Microcystis aeruginosa G13-11]NCS34158.1 hypothetical protein [Microcystis aeruginosa G11-01]
MSIDYFEYERVHAEGSEQPSIDPLTRGIFPVYPDLTCSRDLADVIVVVGSRIPSSERYTSSYSGGWHDLGPASVYDHLVSPDPNNSVPWGRDLSYLALGYALPHHPAIPVILFGVSQFHEMLDYSRTGLVDLGSLAIP